MTPPCDNPFSGLPVDLVDGFLSDIKRLSADIAAPLEAVRGNRDRIRGELADKSLLRSLSSGREKRILSSCGIARFRTAAALFSSELIFSAAFAVEGLIPDGGTKRWDEPAHRALVLSDSGSSESGKLLDALSLELVVELGGESPHEIVFMRDPLRMPFASVLAAMLPAMRLKEREIGREFLTRVKRSLGVFETMCGNGKSGKSWVAVPAGTPAAELGEALGLGGACEDRIAATLLLSDGEYTAPISAAGGELKRVVDLPIRDEKFAAVRDRLVRSMKDVGVVYFRPAAWMPAVRIELDMALAGDDEALSGVLATIRYQCGNPGLDEPYPLYAAQRMVRALERSVPELRRTAAAAIVESGGGSLTELVSFLNMQDTAGSD